MVFGTFDFLIFFAFFLFFYWSLRPWPAARNLFLAAGSFYYYYLIDPRFVLLIVASAIITYFAGTAKKHLAQNNIVKIIISAGILANLGILFWFKYYDFFRVSAQSLFASLGLPAILPYWEIIFPVGVSFFTFRMISYLADVYRNKYHPENSLIDFCAYALFFPCLLAGPIIRAGDFLPQLKKGASSYPQDIYQAAALLFLGLFKKIIISAWIAAAIADNAFSLPAQISAPNAWLAMFSYSLQIYCDFSGYSDIAIACAMFLGFKIAPNFDFPYHSRSIAEFWRRWHISFYSWMRDYVYIPLGGNRVGEFKNLVNILVVFSLSGLWHGAAGHFLAWGLWHGVGLSLQRVWSRLNFHHHSLSHRINSFCNWFLTLLFVSAGWILFRSDNLGQAKNFAISLFKMDAAIIDIKQIFIVVAILFFVIMEKKLLVSFVKAQGHIPGTIWPFLVAAAIAGIYYFAPDTVPPFIYFSF